MLQTGSQIDVRQLCARSSGWDVQLREGGKRRPLDKLRAELRQGILSATRRHLEARANVMEIVASPGETHRVARSDDSHPAAASCADADPSSTSSAAQPTSAKRPRVARSDESHLAAASRAAAEPSSTSSAAQRTSAKRPLRIAPETHLVARSDDSQLAADIDSLYKRVRGAIIKVAADEPDALDLASQAMKKLEKDGSTEGTRTASSQHKVHCVPANVSSDKCRGSLNLRS